MVQPRKEQVKNLKTKYTEFTSVGTLSLSGGPVQEIVNTGIESFYDNLLNSMVTKVVGGAETSAPGMLFGSQGPFTLSTGNSFSITLPGVNGGLAITITLLAGDIITLNSLTVTTVSRISSRINTTLAGFGIIVAVASNIEGRLVLKSADASGYTVGDSASITIQDITPGVVAILGIDSGTFAVNTGTTSPKRGIVTVSNDGLGGIVQFKNYDGSPANPINPPLSTAGRGELVQESGPGNPIFARLRAFPGPVLNGRKFQFSYFRDGHINPRIRSGATTPSNFTTILNTENISITLNYGNGKIDNFVVDFSTLSPIVTAQNVVDTINYWLRDLNVGSWTFGVFYGPVVQVGKEPFTFTDQSTRDSFFISGNGLAPIHINPPSSVISNVEFSNYIDSQITAAAQTGTLTTATHSDGTVHIVAQNTFASTDVNFGLTPNSAYTATLEILPGNPGGSVPGTYMDTLDYLGVAPGIYKASTCARLVGGDEIEIFCPSSLPGASLQITGSATIMGKLGLPTSVNVSPTSGIQPIISPLVRSLLPEMMEFSEETDNYDSTILNFKNESGSSPVNPLDGTANAGLLAILDGLGKINPQLIPKILEYLSVNSLKLGSEKLGDAVAQRRVPSLELPFDGSGSSLSLMWKVKDTNSTIVSRLYSAPSSILVFTNNASWDGTNWNRDDVASSTLFEINSSGTLSFGSHDGTASWTDASWIRATKLNETVSSSSQSTFFPPEILRLGENLVTGTQKDIPRISTVADPITRVLIQKISSANRFGAVLASTSDDIYIYSSLSTLGTSFLEIVVNASYDSTTSLWTKNIAGHAATKYAFGQTEFHIATRDALVVGTWLDSAWNRYPHNYSFLTPFDNNFSGGVTLGNDIPNASTPRIKANRYSPSTEHRTLLFETPVTGTGATLPVRIYINTSSAFLSQGITITRNCSWDSVTDLWHQDVPAFSSTAFHFGNSGDTEFAITNKDAGAVDWADTNTGWDLLTKGIKIRDNGTNFLDIEASGEFRYITAKSSSISCPMSWYNLSHGTFTNIWVIPSSEPGTLVSIGASVLKLAYIFPKLPTGSVIRRIKMFVDPGATEVIEFRLYTTVKYNIVPAPKVFVATATSSGFGFQTLDSGAVSVTVNNSFSASNLTPMIEISSDLGSGGVLYNVQIDFDNNSLSNA